MEDLEPELGKAAVSGRELVVPSVGNYPWFCMPGSWRKCSRLFLNSVKWNI